MGEVVIFRRREPAVCEPEAEDLDILTAVDVAIRDLADILRDWGAIERVEQAQECRRMLMHALDRARA